MERYGACALILLGLFAVIAQPDDKTGPKKEESGKIEPITEEKLIGDWEGKFENGSVKVKFAAKGDRKVAVAVLVLKVGGSVTVGSAGYEIDGKKNEVKFPFAKDAAAKPTKDGALMLSGQFTFGGKIYTVPETRIERAKAEPKKQEPLTREGLLGSHWKGEYQGGTIEMEFRKLPVLLIINTGGGETIGNVPWEIDAKKNEIKFGEVTAKPTKDGTLVLNGNVMLGLTTFTFKEVLVERTKATKEPKK